MTGDERAYVGDLIRTAEDHYARAVALLQEAARIAGGEARDAPAAGYRPPPDLVSALAATLPAVPKLL